MGRKDVPGDMLYWPAFDVLICVLPLSFTFGSWSVFGVCVCVVVVTYKKRHSKDNGKHAQNGQGEGGVGGTFEDDSEDVLGSGQFGITDPEDEGKE